ncbi:MAG: DUF5658 family protein [Planctomycetaceae bacterium]
MEIPVQERAETEHRGETDRRRARTPLFSRYWLVGRRKGARRAGEGENIYVDRYRWAEWGLVAGILVLSALDLIFTLIHLAVGGEEANPAMAWLLSRGRGVFGAVKMGTTMLGLLVLLLHVRFRRVRTLLIGALCLYAALMGWHLVVAVVRGG